MNYRERESLMTKMFTNAADFENNKEAANIDYVYVGDYERGKFGSSLIDSYFRENYECVYNKDGVEIFKIR